MHETLVNRLGGLSLPRKSVVMLTNRPDMTLDVYRGRKTTIQQQQIKKRICSHVYCRQNENGIIVSPDSIELSVSWVKTNTEIGMLLVLKLSPFDQA